MKINLMIILFSLFCFLSCLLSTSEHKKGLEDIKIETYLFIPGLDTKTSTNTDTNNENTDNSNQENTSTNTETTAESKCSDSSLNKNPENVNCEDYHGDPVQVINFLVDENNYLETSVFVTCLNKNSDLTLDLSAQSYVGEDELTSAVELFVISSKKTYAITDKVVFTVNLSKINLNNLSANEAIIAESNFSSTPSSRGEATDEESYVSRTCKP